jgi:hypothetical protein
MHPNPICGNTRLRATSQNCSCESQEVYAAKARPYSQPCEPRMQVAHRTMTMTLDIPDDLLGELSAKFHDVGLTALEALRRGPTRKKCSRWSRFVNSSTYPPDGKQRRC